LAGGALAGGVDGIAAKEPAAGGNRSSADAAAASWLEAEAVLEPDCTCNGVAGIAPDREAICES
jgi:hypothetical protein